MKTVAELIRTPPPKQRCDTDGCPSAAYWNGKRWLCVICDDSQFEECTDCGNLIGWCVCNGEIHPTIVQDEEQSAKDLIVDQLVAANGESVRAKDLHAAISRSPCTINVALTELVEAGLAVRVKHGHYAIPKERNQ